jgi:hypothetical protein
MGEAENREVAEELQAAQGWRPYCHSRIRVNTACCTGEIRMTRTAYFYANWRVSTEKKNKWGGIIK